MTSKSSNGKPEPVANSLATVHHSMLDGMGQLSTYLGFSSVMGQIYGLLLLSPKPRCLDDLVEDLEISKASASINMRTLENFGMVRQVWVKGGRRKFYEAETDFWQIITNIVKGREMRDVDRAIGVMTENLEILQRSSASMNEADREVAALYTERITQMQALFEFAQAMINTILNRVNTENDEAP